MLVLLPPSEGKAAPGRGKPLDLGSLSLPELTDAREAVLDALVSLCAGDEDKALDVLGLGPGLRGEVAKNAALRTAGTRPAERVYTGVLYDALGLAELDAAARRRARRSLLVFSGLWGAVRVGDRIPSYRCPVGVKLPGLGALGPYWRRHLGAVLPQAAARARLVLDLRSAAYAAAWRPAGELAERTATVRVLHGGAVVSHFNKATKGRIVRDLLTSGADPAGPAELAGVLRDLGYAVTAAAPERAGRGWALDVEVEEL
ncbi:peroxide stress protein YaaA [Streptomyces sp. B1866]|uniref:peroxide stress protein YaaA n=1 Tax=Streptomyces sp. B1866 TaxID=3075431 RepID=UPI0028916FF1|nr:peroxide stress protein YaaA [Streptomyces sp. B1866]MDT3398708.1 peroxide stress protein YaaA [Streptomyces sp. B1866]